MNKKYNLALIPSTQNETFIQLANQFRSVSYQYILGPHSLPHVTLRQFYADPDEINLIWDKASKITPQTLNLSFESFSFTTSNQEVFWIALLPNHLEKLYELHQKVSSVLEMSVNEQYYPHLTLCNTLHQNAAALMLAEEQRYRGIKDSFRLALGDCDDQGQFVCVGATGGRLYDLRL